MAFHCIRCKNELDKSFKACPKCGEPVTEFLRDHLEQPLDGKYEILERLGAGGMGEVYKVRHTYLGSTRVIKVVHPLISDNTDARDRFLREARASTKIQHPNVATLHDFSGLPNGAHYMVWEFIDGENLAQRLRARHTLPPRQAVKIVIQALRGLEAIHRAGIIHRDISPENLMITHEDETVKIIDLGVAKVEDSFEVAATATGIFVGKLRYASPEQLGFLPEGEKIDARADLYSLAMVLYEMLTGRPPYEAKSPHEYFLLHAREQTERRTIVLPADLPGGAALQAVMAKALASDRRERYSSAREFATALEEVERNLPDARDMPTMAVPLDGHATMRFATPLPASSQVDTLHRETVRETVRTSSPARPAAPTPPPMPQTAAPTVLTPLPSAAPGPAAAPPPPPYVSTQTRMRQGINPIWIIAGILLLIGAAVAAAVAFWPMKDRGPIVKTADATTTTANAAPPPSQVAQSSVNVIPEPAPATTTTTAPPPLTATTATVAPVTTNTAPVLSQPVTTTTAIVAPPPQPVTPPVKRPQPVRPAPVQEPPAAEPEPEPEPVRPRPATSAASVTPAAGVYIDGGGDDTANERAMEVLRKEMRGVTEVELRGDMYNWLQRTVRNTGLSIAETADVVINFEGKFEQLGRGRKRRAARVTVTKHGKPIFRYVLPEEVYRVGDAPPEAFARVLSDAVE